MKNKSKHARAKKIKEFRYHKILIKKKNNRIVKIYHPAYVFLEKGNVYIYATITHSVEINGVKTIEMITNPNPKDKRKSYRVKGFYQDSKDSFGRRRDEWLINPLDDEIIRKEYEEFQKTKKDDSADQDESWLISTGGLAPTNHRNY